MRSRISLALCALTVVVAAAPSRTIVQTAAGADDFKTLVTALKAAQLDGVLQGQGPFTVFAPTDAAFGLLPANTVSNLLKRHRRGALQSILKYHVVSGRLNAADLIERRTVATINGQTLTLSRENAGLSINGARVTTADIACSNGVIHVIDSVLLPESKTVLDVAHSAGSFRTLLAAVKAAGLDRALRGSGPFTIFAPTDEAFAKLPSGTVQTLLKPENRGRLVDLLKFHVVVGRVDAAAALRARNAKTLAGSSVAIRLENGTLRVANARILTADVAAQNGVIHVIDQVLQPATPEARGRASVMKLVENAIDRGAPRFNDGDMASCVAIYATAAEGLVELGSTLVTKGERTMLESALASTKIDREQAWEFRRAFDAIYKRLDQTQAAAPSRGAAEKREGAKAEFKPRLEAPLPKGFPQPGPVGRVVVKSYPQYRAARSKGGNSFWTLFRHIKKNDIAMTAPVEMTMDEKDGTMVQADMAFLYESPQQGSKGADGNVSVLDLAPVEVLSVGIRGPMGDGKVESAKAAIESHLRKQGWKRDGAWRLLGYNSPMVPAAQRFWELQLPVVRVKS